MQLRSATAKLKNDMDLEMATILDASSNSFTWGALQNKGWLTPIWSSMWDMMFPVWWLHHHHTIPILQKNTWSFLKKGTNINPAEERMAIPPKEYIVNPAEGNNIDHAEGDNVILPRNDIPDAAPGFGGPYNIINPEVNDILDVAGFGENKANPLRNDNLDSLDTVLKGFDGFLYVVLCSPNNSAIEIAFIRHAVMSYSFSFA
ncbi:hypothetical protein GQ457_14G020940 [Hibiscus cannabinus]